MVNSALGVMAISHRVVPEGALLNGGGGVEVICLYRVGSVWVCHCRRGRSWIKVYIIFKSVRREGGLSVIFFYLKSSQLIGIYIYFLN